ncbi:hypothetical protein V6E05_10000 [Citrobacter freundii]|uniref:hypothetical protein n=1 Tax=Citrobacter TaxID=544 RepID=UPI0002412F55|nr:MULTISPECIES: hypothetical protein [Citrobacter]EHL80537.1 hypothetical protein HMPREF9428_01634 [Citrobacter portucalensis]MDE9635915.1 hypothetical protein [Citrobacter freundii]MDM3135069.1 hypothetical protein [Citrobacter sp. Cf123]MDM3225666.1 hypothetical protein [Citrobacter sp. Cf087]OIY07448.1 hypothetical protein BED43_24440 [Citrobacter freundii]
MKPSGLLILLTLIFSNFAFSGVNSISSLSVTDEQQFNEKIKEVKNTGLKPTDENIYNICFASSMLLVNAANDAVSGQFVGDKWIGDLLLISHDEYRNIVKKLIKTGGVMEIKNNPEYFDKNFQMNCRASPEEYIKNYNNIFRLKLTKEDLKNQW